LNAPKKLYNNRFNGLCRHGKQVLIVQKTDQVTGDKFAQWQLEQLEPVRVEDQTSSSVSVSLPTPVASTATTAASSATPSASTATTAASTATPAGSTATPAASTATTAASTATTLTYAPTPPASIDTATTPSKKKSSFWKSFLN